MNQTNTQLEQSLQPISFIERCLKVDEYHRGGKESANTDAMTRTCLKVDQDNQESIPIFGRCRSLEQMKTQLDLFTKQETQYTRQSVIHVQSMIYDKLDARIIMKFMKSISVIVDATSTKFLIDNNPDLQLIYKYKVTRNPDIQMEDYKLFVTYWDQVYNEKMTLSKNIIKQEKLEENKNVDWQRLYTFIRQQHYDAEQVFEVQRMKLHEQNIKQHKEEQQKQEKIRIQVLEMSKQTYCIYICKIKTPKTLRLTANEHIIIAQRSNSGYIPISSNQKVYYLNNGHRLFNKFENIQYFNYIGSLNRNYEAETTLSNDKLEQLKYTIGNQNGPLYKGGIKDSLLHGQGELKLESQSYKGRFASNMRHGEGQFLEIVNGKEQKYKGNFDSDLKSGKFDCGDAGIKYFHNDILLDGPNQNEIIVINNGQSHVYKYEQSDNPSYTILYYNQISINNHQLNTLNFGKWLNQSIVDYYLQICMQYYKIHEFKNIKFINTSEFQNIFGSILVPDYQISEEHIIKKDHGYQKVIIALNLDQSHFVSVVIEDNSIYLFDSLKTNRLLLINSIKQLFENGKALEFNAKFEVSQQKNYYDCGVYTSYYIQKMMSLQKQQIEVMSKGLQFNVQQRIINQFRFHMRKVILAENLPPFDN